MAKQKFELGQFEGVINHPSETAKRHQVAMNLIRDINNHPQSYGAANGDLKMMLMDLREIFLRSIRVEDSRDSMFGAVVMADYLKYNAFHYMEVVNFDPHDRNMTSRHIRQNAYKFFEDNRFNAVLLDEPRSAIVDYHYRMFGNPGLEVYHFMIPVKNIGAEEYATRR